MKLITKAIEAKLISNGQANASGEDTTDFEPVVKLFTPWANATWLLTEIMPDGDTLFGLCDLGLGTPELGYVSLSEIESLTGPGGLKVERDMHFTPTAPLSSYALAASEAGYISDAV